MPSTAALAALVPSMLLLLTSITMLRETWLYIRPPLAG